MKRRLTVEPQWSPFILRSPARRALSRTATSRPSCLARRCEMGLLHWGAGASWCSSFGRGEGEGKSPALWTCTRSFVQGLLCKKRALVARREDDQRIAHAVSALRVIGSSNHVYLVNCIGGLSLQTVVFASWWDYVRYLRVL